MKPLVALTALSVALSAIPAFAQQKPPGQKPVAAQPAQQKPAAPQPAPAAPAVRPFPDGAKIAYCSLDQVASLSKEGQASFAKVRALNDQKVKLIQDKTKAMEANQTLANSASVADDKRAALQREISRQQVEIQRLQQDASTEVTDLQSDVRDAFIARVVPIIRQVASEKGLQMVLNYQDGLLLWVEPGLDLSAEVARRLDATPAPAAPKTPAP
jgi:Skp family chaperone for outer membrane proteins